MIMAIRQRVTVEQEGKIEIHHPSLSVGRRVEVIVLVEQSEASNRSLVSFIGAGKNARA
ncbi:MAG: hypothetical protein ACJ75H_21080 [Thermoanaerobaculia bacterium]